MPAMAASASREAPRTKHSSRKPTRLGPRCWRVVPRPVTIVFQNRDKRQRPRSFCRANLKEFVTNHNYDGVDIDWEVPEGKVEADDCTAFMQTLRNTFPSPQYLLSMAAWFTLRPPQTAKGHNIVIEDRTHPITAQFDPKNSKYLDEWYEFNKNPRPNTHVLGVADEQSLGQIKSKSMGDHPMIWDKARKVGIEGSTYPSGMMRGSAQTRTSLSCCAIPSCGPPRRKQSENPWHNPSGSGDKSHHIWPEIH